MNKRTTRGDRIFQWAINIIAVLICLITIYPLIYVVSASLSEPIKLMSGDVVLWPVGLNVNSYRRVFASADIINGYKNTIIYATSGTLLNLVLTIFAAYPLSMPDMKGKNFVTFMITFMMYLRKKEMMPLQVLLRQILLMSQMGDMAETYGVDDANTLLLYESLKYAIIVISAVPLLIIYPLIQKFFEKGIMMGSIKG